MGFREFDLPLGEESLQVLLNGLLSVKPNNLPELGIGTETDGRLEIQIRLLIHSRTSNRTDSSGGHIEDPAVFVRWVSDAADDVLR